MGGKGFNLALAMAALGLLASPRDATAHAVGESYIFLDVHPAALVGHAEIHFDDLANKLGLDPGEEDAKVFVRTHQDEVQKYIRDHFEVRAGARVCVPRFISSDALDLPQGRFAVYNLRIDIDPLPDTLTVENRMLFENDPRHRNLLLINRNAKTGELRGPEATALIFGPETPVQELDLLNIAGLLGVRGFLQQGALHIWIGIDHMLFLVALILPSVLDRRDGAWVPVAKGAIDPSNKKLDFDTVASLNAGDDWLEGNMYGGRLELFPIGYFKPEQGDFKRELKAALAVGAFGWDNDDDHVNIDVDETTGEESYSNSDVDSVTGVEVSGAIRVAGVSIDAEYNVFEAELVHGKSGADGIYENGETTLENYAVEGGVMVVPSKLELVAGYQSQDADGYAKTWNRTSVGANFFVAKHDIKYQVSYRMGENKDGKDGNDVDELFVQAQYVF